MTDVWSTIKGLWLAGLCTVVINLITYISSSIIPMPLSDLLLVMNSSHHGLFHFQIVVGWQYWQTNKASWRFALCAAHESIDRCP
jgi:hypothetical protein